MFGGRLCAQLLHDEQCVTPKPRFQHRMRSQTQAWVPRRQRTRLQRGCTTSAFRNPSPPHNFGFPVLPQVWDPQAAADTTAEGLHHKHKATPYVGTQLRGRVLATFVRGQQVFAAGRDFPAKPCGGLILRK